MQRKPFPVVYVLVLLLSAMALPLGAEIPEAQSTVTVPWDEFRQLLELDKDEIVLSWEEFQKILEQAGVTSPPPFEMKNEKVVLTREQFKKLLERMKPPTGVVVKPPADYLMTQADYQGALRAEGLSLRAELRVDVFEADRERYVKIPLFPQTMALREVLLDGRDAHLAVEGGRYFATTRQTGAHTISVEFFVKTDPESGQRSISFPIPSTPITRLDLTLPVTGVEVSVPQAHRIETRELEDSTRVVAHLSPTQTVQVGWKRQLPEIEKGPAKVYAETLQHLVIEDDALRVSSQFQLSILQNTISSVTLRTTDDVNVLQVQGSDVGDWQEVERGGAKLLEIPFTYPKQGSVAITILAERLLAESAEVIQFTGFALVDAVRERGFLGVELKSTSEASIAEISGIDRLDVSELPPSLVNRSQKPLLFGFKYQHHPYSLVLDLTAHEELPTISTVVDFASGVTLFTEDGKRVHRVAYSVRNNSKQFMELELPEGAQVWSVFVAGQPAKPRIHEKTILIPLNRSTRGASGLAAFEVEIIFFEKGEAFGWSGRRTSPFLVPDILMSQALWSVYLPTGYSYFNFGGTVEKERSAPATLGIFETGRRPVSQLEPAPAAGGDEEREMDYYRQKARKLKRDFSANLAIPEEQLAEQVMNEQQFGRRVQGLQDAGAVTASGPLPIRINIPTTGHIYRFAKTIVSEEPLEVRFAFVSAAFQKTLNLGLLVVLLALMFSLRRRLKALIDRLRAKAPGWSGAALPVGLSFLLWGLSPLAAAVALLLGLALLVRWWMTTTGRLAAGGESE